MLLNNITEIKSVLRVSPSTSYELLASHLANAENAFLLPLLGSDMYNALLKYHDDPANFRYTDPDLQLVLGTEGSASGSGQQPPDEKSRAWALVLWLAQHAVVHMAYFAGFDVLNAYISDAGFQRTEGERTKSLFKYQEDNLKRYFLDTGMTSLDQVLEYLERYREYFEQFDTALRQINSRIFPTTANFQAHLFINNSRLTFLRLQQHIRTIEELDITQAVGADNMNYIYAELQKEAPAEKVVKLLPYLRAPIAYLASAMLMEESGADLTERGLYFKAQRSISNSDFIMHTDEPRIIELVRRNKELGQMYLNRLLKYLNDSTEWDHQWSPSGRIINRDNTDKKIFVT